MYIEKRLKEIELLIEYFESVNETNEEKVDENLYLLEQLIGENPLLIEYKSISLYNASHISEAKKYLNTGLKKHVRSYSLYAVSFELMRYSRDYKNVYYALAQMLKLAEDTKTKDEVTNLIQEYSVYIKLPKERLDEYYELIKKESTAKDYRAYPINEYGDSVIRQDAFPGRDVGNNYLVNMYKSIYFNDINSSSRLLFLYEMIKGRFIKNKVDLQVGNGDVIAISSANKENVETNINIRNLEKTPLTLKLESNVIRYFKIRRSKEIKIKSDQEVFVSHFKKVELQNKPKLVVQIFVDGLSQQFLKENKFDALMPNMSEFFNKGYINDNCHANGEWTLPSLMSMSTGKYTTNHFVYHTDEPHKGEDNNKFVQEYFEEAGYITGRICSNWRGTPSYGYFKGTKRSVYSPMFDRMDAAEIINEAIEHMEVFKDFPNHVWLTLEDLHAVADGITRGAFQDINVEKYHSDNVVDDTDISVFRNFNVKKIEEYKSAIKKVDFYLGILFDYITKNYKDDDFLIMVNSDHGQRYIEKEDYLFMRKRTNVPFMMRGRNVPCKQSSKLMSNVDILPTILDLCSLQCDSKVDGQLLQDFGGVEKDYVISESIFPGQTYKLAINDKEHLYMFETLEAIKNDGSIPIKKYSEKLKNQLTGEDEIDKYPEKIEKYAHVTFDHIKEWISFK